MTTPLEEKMATALEEARECLLDSYRGRAVALRLVIEALAAFEAQQKREAEPVKCDHGFLTCLTCCWDDGHPVPPSASKEEPHECEKCGARGDEPHLVPCAPTFAEFVAASPQPTPSEPTCPKCGGYGYLTMPSDGMYNGPCPRGCKPGEK